MIILNLKNYTGFRGEKLREKLEKMREFLNRQTIVAAQPTDIKLTSNYAPTYAQHIDPEDKERNTGSVTASSVKLNGGEGTLLNHSERSLKTETLKTTVQTCKKHSLDTIICCKSVKEAKKYEEFDPCYIAFEPPKLIASDTSVVESDTQKIRKLSTQINTPFLVGAGISKPEDCKKALELGAEGVMVASAVTKSDNPVQTFKKLAEASSHST
jgi:Triosephosphate isomerase